MSLVVLYLLLLMGSYPYTSFGISDSYAVFYRDIFLVATMVLLIGKNHSADRIVKIISVYFLFFLVASSFDYDYLHYFVRNLFFYSLCAYYISKCFEWNASDIYNSIIIIDLVGYVLQYTGVLQFDFENRFVGLFLSPGVASVINVMLFMYAIFVYRGSVYVKCAIALLSIYFIIITGSFLGLALFLAIILFYSFRNFYLSIGMFLFCIIFGFDYFYDRFDAAFVTQNTGTITGRVSAYSDFEFTLFGVGRTIDHPLDSSYLFVALYLGLIGLLMFLAYIFYLYRISRSFYLCYNAAIPVMFIMAANLIICFFYNLNFSFVFNVYLFALLGSFDRVKANQDICANLLSHTKHV